MARFKLLAGQHWQADPDWQPTDEEKKRAEASGALLRAPSRKYDAGQTVESETDLVALFGADKFQLLSSGQRKGRKGEEGDPTARKETPGDPSDVIKATSPAHFPAGQVSTGFQQATGSDQGTVSGPMDPEDIEEIEPFKAPPTTLSAPAGKSGSSESKKSSEKPSSGGHKSASASAPKSKAEAKAALEQKTVPDLKKIADEEEIDLKGATLKSEIVEMLLEEME